MEKLKILLSARAFRLIAVILTILCCLTAIWGLNRPHLNPFRWSLDMKYPTAAAYSDKDIAVIDNQGRRLLILSHDYKLKSVADTSMSGSPVDKIWSVAMYGDRIFAVGGTYFNKGAYFSSESVIEYDRQGKVVQTVYSQTYSENEKVNCQHFIYIITTNDGIYLTIMDDREVSAIRIAEETEEIARWTLPETVYSAGYSPVDHYGTAICNSQNIYYLDEKGGIKTVSNEDYILGVLDYFSIPADSVDMSLIKGCYCVPYIVVNNDGEAQYYCLLNTNEDVLFVLSNDMSEQTDIGSVEYSMSMTLRTLGYWVAIAFICVELVILLVWLMLNRLQKKGMAIILTAAVIVLISLYYTRQLQNASEESYYDSLVTQTKQFSYILSKSCGDIFSELRSYGIETYCTDVENQDDIAEVRNVLKTMCDANGSGRSCYASCYLFDSSGVLYTFTDSCNACVSGERVYLAEDVEKLLGESLHEPITVELASDTLVYDYDYIYDSDSNIVGVLCISASRGNLHYLQLQNTVNTTVTLTALLVGVYMLISVAKMFSADFKRRRSRDPMDIRGRSLDAAGAFSFAQGIISGLDSVIVVYVARSLCAGMNADMQALCVALPITFTSIGCLLGARFTSTLCRLVGDRKCSVLSTVITAAAMLAGIMAINLNSIIIFSVVKLIVGFFFGGVMFVMRQTLPHRSDNENDRQAVLASVLKSSFAAIIISALISGYVSHYISYKAMYMTGAVLCILFIALCLMCFPRGDKDERTDQSEDKQGTNRREYLKLYFQGPGLIYLIFYILPFSLLGGYKTYLFPMYTAGAGISALLLSNLSVFVHTFSFLISGTIKSFTKRLNRNAVLIAPMLIICGGLVCFIISPNVYWAIAVLLIYEVMQRSTSSARWMHITELAESRQLDAKTAYGKYLTLENLVSSLQSPILSQFAALGINYAGAAVGTVCGVMIGIFGIFNRQKQRKQ